MGDSVPSAAIVADYWLNGAPLYIIHLTTKPTAAIFIGYYDAECISIRPQFKSMKETSLRTLVSTL